MILSEEQTDLPMSEVEKLQDWLKNPWTDNLKYVIYIYIYISLNAL